MAEVCGTQQKSRRQKIKSFLREAHKKENPAGQICRELGKPIENVCAHPIIRTVVLLRYSMKS